MATHGKSKTLLASAARTATGNSDMLNTGVGSTVSVHLSTTAKTGTTPTITATIQWSFDNSTWYNAPTADNFTVITDTAVASEFKDIVCRAPYMRVHYVFGGTATPGYTFTIHAYVRN